MRDGFIKVAAATPGLKVGDVAYNVERICRQIAEADGKGAKVIVFPELAITGYTCGDLFFQQTLLQAAEEGLTAISRFTAGAGSDAVVFVGLPMEMDGKLYNVAACIQSGKILGLITKKNLPNYDEYQELRYFTPGNEMPVPVMIGDDIVPFGMNIVIDATSSVPGLMIGCEICEDAWVRETPSTALAAVGVTLMVNLSASAEYISKAQAQRELVAATSKRLTAGYVYASAGPSESTSDMIFSGHRLIYENGHKLAEGELFTEGLTISEIDVERLVGKRRKMNTYTCIACAEDMYHRAIISFDEAETILTRPVAPLPFVPGKVVQQMEHVIMMQVLGLKKRMEHIGAKKAVIGISGGLDSTLALVATCKAFSMMGRDASDIIGITMPCFGTSDRTYKNACDLIKKLGCTFREINIKEAVTLHLKDIGHDLETHDAAFENAQARERTQILMDVANSENGIVIGTGDLSELALGWCTYNGDQMSMYGLNAGVPKTLIRAMISYLAEKKEYADVADNLRDVVATPVSPELLPLKDGEIGQKTEDIVGPYELHDFFLYHIIHDGFTPKKIYRLACIAFAEGDITFEPETIKKWMKVFYRRFVTQQYKRAAMPDGMRITNVSLSPRSTFRMPSDVSTTLWMDEVERL